MSLSTVTLKTLRSDLRLRTNELTEDNFTDEVLDNWLNIAQYEVAIKLNGVSERWYGTTHTMLSANLGSLAGNIGYYDISASKANLLVLKLINMIYYSSAIEVFHPTEYNELSGYVNNSYFGSTKPLIALFGEKVYFSVAAATISTNITAGQTYILSYFRKPVPMTSSLDLDVPSEYQDLVIMGALTKLYEAKEMSDIKLEIEKQMAEKFKEIKQSFIEGDSNDISTVKK